MITDGLLHIFKKDLTFKRDVLKTISWRIVGSIDTAMLGWIITGHLKVGMQIGALELATKMFLYFVHERVWHRFQFGKPSKAKIASEVRRENRPNLFKQQITINRRQREELNGSPASTIWLTGLSGSGKSTIASGLDEWFYNQTYRCYLLDGDNTRLGINSDLSFTEEDRAENIRRVAEICKLFNEAGIIVVASFISPFEKDRETAARIIGPDNFKLVHIDASVETCKQRDTKGLYKLAEEGKLKNFTGVDSPYEIPANAAVSIPTDKATPEESLWYLTEYVSKNILGKVSKPIST
jgi:adenylylsulfate kinase